MSETTTPKIDVEELAATHERGFLVDCVSPMSTSPATCPARC